MTIGPSAPSSDAGVPTEQAGPSSTSSTAGRPPLGQPLERPLQQPAYGQPASIQPASIASFGSRVGAHLLDGVVLFALLIPIGILNAILAAIHLGFLGTLLLIVWWVAALAYLPFFHGQYGQTIGKRVCHICVVDENTAAPIGFGRAFARYLVLWLSSIPFYVGLFSPLFDGSRRMQGWHDKAAQSLVVNGDAADWPAQLAFLKPAPSLPLAPPSSYS